MRRHLDDVAVAHGLVDARDWIVLGEVAAGPPRTQLALAHELGLDKTTFTALVDRLEDGGLVRRTADCRDRRAKIPQVTDRGRAVHAAVDADRRAAECTLLTAFTDREQTLLRTLLGRLADDGCAPTSCQTDSRP